MTKTPKNAAFFIVAQSGTMATATGDPGVAKTAIIEHFAKQLKRVSFCCILSQKGPEEVKGYPAIRTRSLRFCGTCSESRWVDPSESVTFCCGNVTRNLGTQEIMTSILEEVVAAAHLAPSVLFFDEILNTPAPTQAAALQVIGDPPPNTVICGAGNPIASAADGHELTPPMVNRMCLLEWEAPVKEAMTNWASGFRDYPEPVIPIVPDNFLDTHGAKWHGILADYSAAIGYDQVTVFPKKVEEQSQPWQSLRSLTNACKALAAADAIGLAEDKVLMCQILLGMIGKAGMTQFMEYWDNRNLPNPEDLLRDPQLVKQHIKARGDIARTVCGSVLSALASDKTCDRYDQCLDVIEQVYSVSPELAQFMWGELVSKGAPEDYQATTIRPVIADMARERVEIAKEVKQLS